MALADRMVATACAICGTPGNAHELYKANLAANAFRADIFSARRLPDGIHYRLVRCRTCGLVRSDPIADPATIHDLYTESAFAYDLEVEDLNRTYGRYLATLERYHVSKGRLLEIGCGNGFFLETALHMGYARVAGVEPSVEAVSRASPVVRDHIVCDIMRPGLFEPGTFSVVCLFQVLDHLCDPGVLLDEALSLLEPGGLILCINHDVDAIPAKLLRERSPIVDVEHTYLYSPDTMRRLFVMHGFTVKDVGVVYNTYSLRYLTQLLPLLGAFKRPLVRWLQASAIGRLRLSVPLGNLALIAERP